jgi:hypothetical protein
MFFLSVWLDVEGEVYWSQVDECAKVRVYREDQEHKDWNLLVENREELG